MKKKIMLLVSVVGMLAAMTGIGQATSWSGGCATTTPGGKITNTCTQTGNDKLLEPLLTRSSAAPIYANCEGQGGCTEQNIPTNSTKNGNANIKSLKVATGNGRITATVSVEQPFVRSATDARNLPYAGQEVLVMFQTDLFQQNQQIGTDPAGNGLFWGPPGYNADGFRWFIYYGWTASENRDVCGLGYYDPTGEIVPPAPVFFGQTFFAVGQKSATPPGHQNPNTTCAVASDGKSVVITQPYRYTWTDSTNIPQSIQVVDPTGTASEKTLSNVSAFSWLEHEIGGPDPVGLILGYTWYTDALPIASYDVGVIAGDPNPFAVAGPKCYTNLIGGMPDLAPAPQPSPVPPPGVPGPCTVANPIGPGFNPSGLSVVASS